MIKRVAVRKLNDRVTANLQFNEDLNLITGKNGSAKTSLLKLIWYSISGNIERIGREIVFDHFEIDTDRFKLRISKTLGDDKGPRVEVVWSIDDKPQEKRTANWRVFKSGGPDSLQEINRRLIEVSGQSIFFPTFRRIEGGYSLQRQASGRYGYYAGGELQEALNSMSAELSVGQHRFVASHSTSDLERLLTTRYADLSEKVNQLHRDFSEFIRSRIKGHGEGEQIAHDERSRRALGTIDELAKEAARVDAQREELLKPFNVVGALVAEILQYRGVSVAHAITLGESKEAIASDWLSAGEKQMLSFLCYNAFSKDTAIFIDEPEISLHIDWQRILFPKLLDQSSGNQFIVATHSPFIYSKYPDKELAIHPDRGASEHGESVTQRQ